MGAKGGIPAAKLRGVGKLPHLKVEAEITQKELADLENRKILANLGGGKGENNSTPRGKGKAIIEPPKKEIGERNREM